MKNWKTTSAGIAMIVGGLVSLYFSKDVLNAEMITAHITAILGGIGLIFAKDQNVTGGNTPQ